MSEPAMRVAHVLDTLEGGGTERGLVRLLGAMRAEGGGHEVVTLRRAGDGARALPSSVACRAFDTRRRAARVGCALAAHCRARRVRVLHARGLGAWADAMLARALMPRCRLVLGFHGLEHDGPFSRSQLRRVRWGLRLGARWCCVSYAGRDKLMAEAGAPEDRVDVLPNGVDLARFAPLDPALRRRRRAELGFADEHFVFICVASLTEVKDHRSLLEAFGRTLARDPHARLLLVGDGPLREPIERCIRDNGWQRHVVLTGQREDVPALLGGSDAYVCSSRSEGMSHAVLEAMAAGLPIVATRVGDNPRLLQDAPGGSPVAPADPLLAPAGLLVAPRATEELAAAMIRILTHMPLRQALARNAKARAEAYSLTAMARRYLQYYEGLGYQAHR
ncbi:MAG: glycosyltransferase [Phycisphaerales bacterium]|nr:glycosyltransferase [Phycisphaerales bacterium]